MSLAMLQLSGVSKDYSGGIKALCDINLQIPKGMFGLLGPNGAGKSTLMRTIATLQAPDAGTITFGDINVLQQKTELRKVLGYLPQEFGSYPRTSAQNMLCHFAALKGLHGRQQQAAVEQLLVRTNLWDARKRNVDTFSGGMKQRFGIAQALLGNPQLLIVDEPTAGLDPAERRRFQNLLAEVGEEIVVILSTHIVDDIAELCPRLAIMGQGRILLQGEPQALMSALRGKLWAAQVSREDGERLRKQHLVLSCRLRSGRVEVRAIAPEQPPGMVAATPDLEDVYFATLSQHGLTANLE
jgi:ABC-type multidrug transport system ATPase subunit